MHLGVKSFLIVEFKIVLPKSQKSGVIDVFLSHWLKSVVISTSFFTWTHLIGDFKKDSISVYYIGTYIHSYLLNY